MTDLYPGMTIEISTAFIALPDISARPAWLSDTAMWPPIPGQVMYMMDDSIGICDQCITDPDCQKYIEDLTRGGIQKVMERGRQSWYCSCQTRMNTCERHWNGREYDRDHVHHSRRR